MPFRVVKRGSQWCVVETKGAGEEQTDREPFGCHPTEAEAQAQMRALYRNVPEARAAGLTIVRAGAPASAPTPPAVPALPAGEPHGATACSCHDAPARTAAAIEPFDTPFPVPEYAPGSWFTERPAWMAEGRKLQIDDAGRVAGYFWEWGADGDAPCIIGHPGYPRVCAPPVPSPTGYAAFHQNGPIVLDDGSELLVGVLGDIGGHASPFVSPKVASATYSDAAAQRVYALAYDDDHGAYLLGALKPRIGRELRPITYGDVAHLRGCALSGDWREMDPGWFDRCGVNRAAAAAHEWIDCLGPTIVTRPALPLVRAYRVAAAGEERPRIVLQGAVADEPSTTIEAPANRARSANVQPITLADGTILEVPDGASIEAADGRITVRLAAPPPPPAGDGPPAGDEGNGEEAALDNAELTAAVRALADRLDAIEQAMGDMRAAAAGEAERRIAGLDPVVL